MAEQIPVCVKGSVFGTGNTSADITGAFQNAAQNEIVGHRRNGSPVARYDAENKRAYLEATDGTRENINE